MVMTPITVTIGRQSRYVQRKQNAPGDYMYIESNGKQEVTLEIS